MGDKNKNLKAKEQIDFCKELMDRLYKSFNKNISENTYHGIKNHYQMSNDIVRLRRELNTLNKLLYPYD